MITAAEMNEINLCIVAAALGGLLEEGSKTSHNSQMWNIGSAKFGITHKKNVWIDNSNGTGKRGAVALVMHVLSCDYHHARDFLSEVKGSSIPSSYQAFDSSSIEDEVEEDIAIVEFDESKWKTVRQYLIGTSIFNPNSLIQKPNNQRCLNSDLVDRLHAQGKIGSDLYSNVIFKRENGGAFTRSTGLYNDKKYTVGIAAGGCFLIEGEKVGAAAVVESPIDVLSLHQIYPSLTVIAIGGGCINLKQVIKNLDGMAEVYSAFDNDKDGNKYSAKLISLLPLTERLAPPPECKDWNQVLQNEFGIAKDLPKQIDF